MTTGQAAHAERLRDMAEDGDSASYAYDRSERRLACLAGAAALDEVATLRARVQQLEQAMRTCAADDNLTYCAGAELLSAALGTTPPVQP